jgi:alpha-tubulin suppressor-like RCC1 family protein
MLNGKWELIAIGIVGDNTTKTEPLVLRSVQITKEALLGVSVKDVKVSSHFGLLLSKSGQVYTWGNNGGVGSLGRGHLDNAISGPVAVKRWSITGDTISAIAATDETAVIVDSDGKLYTWGGNQHGTLVCLIEQNS